VYALLTNVEVYSSLSSAPDLPLQLGGREDVDLIHIRDVTGLGPVKADINTTQYGTGNGGFYTGGEINTRNIVFKLGFNPDWTVHTVSSLRQLVYGYFMSKQQVRLRFFRDDGPTVEIVGYCETNEPSIFSKDPEMEVSIICPDPDFVAVAQSVVAGVANEDPDSVDFTLVGNIDTTGRLVVTTTTTEEPAFTDPDPDYDGTFKIEHKTLAAGSEDFTITGSIAEGLSLIIDSAIGNKVAENVIGLEHINLLNSMTADSQWLYLHPGTNKIRVIMDAGAPDKAWTLTYYERFGGL
jgi:hypothetical protein